MNDMEQKFDLGSVISKYNLDPEKVAGVLFPKVKYPRAAFNRVLRGETSLDTYQLEKLARYIGVLMSDLFGIDGWKGETHNGFLTFVKGEYKVRLNYGGIYISVYKNDELFYQSMADTPEMTVSEFIKLIDEIIKKHENETN